MSVPSTVVDDAASPRARRSWFRRIDRQLLWPSLVIAAGLVMIAFALARSVTGDDVTDLPSAIEEITPAPDAVQVLQQTQVVVDLAEGYEGRLVIDDIPLETIRLDDLGTLDVEPGEQLEVPPGVVFEPGNGMLTFTPSDDAPISNFDPGSHIVQVVYWPTVEGEERARSYTWAFSAI